MVVTAFYPLEMIASHVGGDLFQVRNLTPPGSEPHDLELRPSDNNALQQADVIFYFGDGFQPVIEKAISSGRNKRKSIDLLAGLSLLKPNGKESEPNGDPHVWLSPRLFGQIATRVTQRLAEELPAHSDEIQKRGASLSNDLEVLDAKFSGRLANCARHEIFTSHAAFAYLAEEYGLRQIAISGLTPEAEPSSQRLQEVADQARRAGATTIFFETLVSPRVSEAVARIVGAKTDVLNPIEGLTRDEFAKGKDYFTIMRDNLDRLTKALGCQRT